MVISSWVWVGTLGAVVRFALRNEVLMESDIWSKVHKLVPFTGTKRT